MADVRKNIDVVIRAKNEAAQGIAASVSQLNQMVPVLGRVAGAAAAAFSVNILRQYADEIHRTSLQLGITYAEMQRLSYAGKILDVDMRNVANAILEIQRRGPDAAVALSTIGLTLDDIRNGRPTEILAQIADGLGKIDDVTTRNNVAFQLFGRSYKELLSAFGEGGDAIRELADAAPIIPDRVIADFDKAGDAIDAMKTKALALIGVLLDWRRTDAEFLSGVGQILGIGLGTSVGPSNIERLRSLGALGGAGGSGAGRVLSLADVPTEQSAIFSDINQPTNDLLRAIDDTLRQQSLALRQLGSQIGGRGMRVGGSVRGMDFAGPVGMFPTSSEEEAQNKALEDRVGHLADLRDQYVALRDGINEVEVQGESLGATLVDGAFQWADTWSRGLALVMTKQVEFADMAKRLWRSMVTEMLVWINKLIARQIVAAILTAILDPSAGSRTAAVIAQIGGAGLGTVSGGDGGGGGGGGGSAFRAPRVATGDYGRTVSANVNITTTFGSQSEVRAAAATFMRYVQAEA